MCGHYDCKEHIENNEEEEDHVGEEENGGNLRTDELKLVVVDRAQHHAKELHEGESKSTEVREVVSKDEVAHENEAQEQCHHHKEEVAKIRATFANGIEENAEGGEDGIKNAE